MVDSVSMSRVRPRVRSSTRPEASPMAAATTVATTRPVIGSFHPPCLASMPTA